MGLEHIFKTEHVFKDFYCTQTVNKELVVTLVCAFFFFLFDYRHQIRSLGWATSGIVSFADPQLSSNCIRNFAISHCHCVQVLNIWGRANSSTTLSTLLKLPPRTGHNFFTSQKNPPWNLLGLSHLPSTQDKLKFSDRCKNNSFMEGGFARHFTLCKNLLRLS